VTKIIGLIPARMKASRFPGKPMALIHGRPMIEHVWHRARMYGKWTKLSLCTCDDEIAEFSRSKGFPVIMTADTHVRALDRVAEAAQKCGLELAPKDIVVCVQGDEPMLRPDMMDAVCKPFFDDSEVRGTVLGIHITDETLFRNPDIVKIVSDLSGDVLYTSRAPIPYCKNLTPEVGARRIAGILAFHWEFLQAFRDLPQTNLEILEACDSNRLCGSGLKQRVAPYPSVPAHSVDSVADLAVVERAIVTDPFWGKY